MAIEAVSDVILNNYVRKADIVIANTLHGFPVTQGLALALIPSLSTVTTEISQGLAKITSLKDPVTGYSFTAVNPSINLPDLGYNISNKCHFLQYGGGITSLRTDNFPISKIVSSNGLETSVVIISTLELNNQFNFIWNDEADISVRLNCHYPWGDGKLYFDFGNWYNGRITSNAFPNPITYGDSKVRVICTTRTSSNSTVFVDGSIVAQGVTTSNFSNGAGGVTNQKGPIYIADSSETIGSSYYDKKIKLYAILVFNRSITEEEVWRITEWNTRFMA